MLAYPPVQDQGIVVLRLADYAHVHVEVAVRRVLELLTRGPLAAFLVDCGGSADSHPRLNGARGVVVVSS
jgi:hypothetical protein